MPSSFEKLEAFQEAVNLSVDVYRVTDSFPRRETYGITAQTRGAAASVVRHLAEGQGRLSVGEWRQFLSQARGSLYEVEANLILALRLGFLERVSYDGLRQKTALVARLIAGLVQHARMREAKQQAMREQSRRRASSTVNRQPSTGNLKSTP
jgi:four helix bundle protein